MADLGKSYLFLGFVEEHSFGALRGTQFVYGVMEAHVMCESMLVVGYYSTLVRRGMAGIYSRFTRLYIWIYMKKCLTPSLTFHTASAAATVTFYSTTCVRIRFNSRSGWRLYFLTTPHSRIIVELLASPRSLCACGDSALEMMTPRTPNLEISSA